MLRQIYDWTLRLADTPYAMAALFVISFVESSVFPIPPDVLLIPMVLARPDRALRIAAVCTVASVLGGLAGYAIGAFLLETVGRPVLEFYGKTEDFEGAAAFFNDWGVWAVLVGGLTPFPYKVVTIFSGVAGFELVSFTVSSLVARGIRFFLLALLLQRYGPPIKAFIEARLGVLFTVFVAALLGGFLVLGLL